ncbi:hypothetical protein ABT030_47650 [Streptomyces mirabilis]|uniref:hypothetical protein n=1 Tax=Streptomyces mirabilis TaxID=68239 RepID=UPI00332781D2
MSTRAAEAPFADLLVQLGGNGDADGELGLQIWLEPVEGYVPAVAGGREQDVEAGVAVAAHGLAVQPEAAGDLAERVADVDHPIDLLVAPYDPVHDQGRRQGLLC